jgi:hypothetical protein
MNYPMCKPWLLAPVIAAASLLSVLSAGVAVGSDATGDHLVFRGKDFAPVQTWVGVPPLFCEGSVLIAVDGADVIATDANSGLMLWKAHEPHDRPLQAFICHDHQLLLSCCPATSDQGKNWDFHGCADILRLDLAHGAWLPPLASGSDPNEPLMVSSVVERSDQLVVSRNLWVKTPWEMTTSALEVSVFTQSKTIWTRRWSCEKSIPPPGALLLGNLQPTTSIDHPIPCTPCGDGLLIIPGPTSALICVNANDGKDRWSIDHLWEFDRDFIGPSVWSHEVRRFGRDAREEAWRRAGTETIDVTPQDKAKVDAKIPEVTADWRAAFESERIGWISGGPWLVHHPSNRGAHASDEILIAVALAPHHPFARNLVQSRIFDIGDNGTVTALIDTPRMIDSNHTFSANGLLCFAGNPCGAGALRPLPDPGFHVMGPGGSDCLISLTWYREPDSAPADAWLQGTWKPAIASSSDFLLSPLDDGLVENADATEARTSFELTFVVSGDHEGLTLIHHMSGKAVAPTENFTKFTRPNGSQGVVVEGTPIRECVTSISLLGGYLILGLGRHDVTNRSYLLAFSLNTLLH